MYTCIIVSIYAGKIAERRITIGLTETEARNSGILGMYYLSLLGFYSAIKTQLSWNSDTVLRNCTDIAGNNYCISLCIVAKS